MSHSPAKPSLEATAADQEARLLQLEALLDETGAEVLVLGQAGHAAWSLCGADLRIQVSSERMWGYVVVRRDMRKVVTWVMDARRFAEEELPDDVEVIAIHPDEGPLESVAVDLAGRGRVLSDCELPGTELALDHLRRVQYPLSDLELRRAIWIAERADTTCRAVADGLEPGLTEHDVVAQLSGAFLREGLAIDEMMVGFDERVRRYRHPVARGAHLERLAFFHPTVNRWGQHAILTRMVSLGSPDDALVERFGVVSEVEAWSVAMTRPGTTYAHILAGQRERYARHGHPDAPREHWQGGQTGFALCEIAHTSRPHEAIPEGGLYNWFITVPGAKKEETTLATSAGGRILTLSGAWPTRTVDTDLGPVTVADLFVR